jgi:hypothetical protein
MKGYKAMDDSILLLESILEEVRKLNSKIEDVCAINKSGTVFQGIYDELYDIKEELSDVESKVSEIADAKNEGY